MTWWQIGLVFLSWYPIYFIGRVSGYERAWLDMEAADEAAASKAAIDGHQKDV